MIVKRTRLMKDDNELHFEYAEFDRRHNQRERETAGRSDEHTDQRRYDLEVNIMVVGDVKNCMSVMHETRMKGNSEK